MIALLIQSYAARLTYPMKYNTLYPLQVERLSLSSFEKENAYSMCTPVDCTVYFLYSQSHTLI